MLSFYLSLIDDAVSRTQFELLYYEYRNLMMHIALEILGNKTVAEDAVHESFVRIADNMNKIKDVKSDKTRMYVTVVTKNVALNMKSKDKRCITLSNEQLDKIVSEYPDVYDSVVVKCMLDKITKLPEIYRDVLSLKVYYGFSNKEIAKHLHISESAVRKRLERLRRFLI